MDKFDEILKKAVEGYEAPYNPGVWDSLSSQLDASSLDPFEKSVKESLDKFQAPHNPAIWENISSQLGGSEFEQTMKESVEGYEAPYNPAAWEAVSSQIGNSSSLWKWVAGSAAAIGLLFGGIYMFSDDDSANTTQQDTKEEKQTQIAANQHEEKTTTTFVNSVDDTESTEEILTPNNAGQGDEVNHQANNGENTNSTNNGSTTSEAGDNSTVFGPFSPNVTDNLGNGHGVGNSAKGEEPNHNNDNPTNNDGNVVNNGDTTPETNQDVTHTYSADFRCVSEGCEGSPIEFAAANLYGKVDYVWSFSDGTRKEGEFVTHSFQHEGDASVKLNVYKKNSNELLASEEQNLTINRNPNPDFVVDQPSTMIPTYNFINQTDHADINWEIDGMGKISKDQFEMTFREKGTYHAKLTATNEFGCTSTKETTIKVDNDYNLFAPNAFTPNATTNRTFIPAALKILNKEFTMTIHAKDGSMVYQTQNANQPWDGRYTTDNRMAPEGVYVWIVQLKNANGEMETYKGTVTRL